MRAGKLKTKLFRFIATWLTLALAYYPIVGYLAYVFEPNEKILETVLVVDPLITITVATMATLLIT